MAQTQPSRQRTCYLDNFRTFLTILVIYHHTSIAYGGEGSVHYVSSHHPRPYLPLLAFNVVNQSFFMAAFFFLSGYFTSLSARRKPLKQILWDRAVRLGLPTAVYTVVAEPIHMATVRVLIDHRSLDWAIVLDDVKSIRGIRGPVWYCCVVLIFDTIYAMLRTSNPIPTSQNTKTVITSSRGISASLLCVTALEFCFRIWHPIDRVWPLLNVRLGYVPQYAFYYMLGHLTPAPLDPFQLASPSPMLATAGSLIFTLSLASKVQTQTTTMGPPAKTLDHILSLMMGGRNPIAFAYALLNELMGYAIFKALLQIFYKRVDFPLAWSIPHYAYAAFIVHRPVSELVEAAADAWTASAITKTMVLGTVNGVVSWAVAWILVQVPGIKRVIG